MHNVFVRALVGGTLALAGLSAAAAAQQPAPPPVRPLGQITRVAPDSLASASAAVQVAGGRVFVNDISARRLLLFDSSLSRSTVVADSSSSSADAYGPNPGTLLPFHGDSALFIAPATLSMLVLSPEGSVVRVMAMPPSNGGIPALIGSIFGTPGFDARGRLAYFTPVRLNFRNLPTSGSFTMEPPDSALVVRFDFASRTLDTAAAIHVPRSRTVMHRDDSGRPSGITITALPPTTVDDWALLADGSLAVLRGRDYHVDWLGADGTWTSTPRMAFGWERMNDEEKTALLDSVATATQTQIDSGIARAQRASASGGAPGVALGGGSGTAGPGGGSPVIITMRSDGGPGGGGPGGPPGGGGPGGPVRTFSMPRPTVEKAVLSDVPDYRPPFRQGAMRADAEGNLWVRTTKMVNGQPVYDVINRAGQVVDRVQLPPFRAIAGFGPGVVYLGVRDSVGVTRLERARIR